MQPSLIRPAVYVVVLMLWAGATGAAEAPSPAFRLPLACTPETDCWIANYVDDDPGPAAKDYTGAGRTYDGHKGTDIAIRDLRVMAAGVDVMAAAPGVVVGTRDGVRDVDMRAVDPAEIKGRECGNGVAIQHANGWRSQYCHMRQGSIRVVQGAQVAAGTVLGQVGLSGETEFPHMHFEVSRNGQTVDPFIGAAGSGPLWATDVQTALAYHASDIYAAGFTVDEPNGPAARRGDYDELTFATPLPAFYLWMDIFGIMPGDRLTLRLFDPNGAAIFDKGYGVDAKTPKARDFYRQVFRHENGPWPRGRYRAEIELARSGTVVARIERGLTLE